MYNRVESVVSSMSEKSKNNYMYIGVIVVLLLVIAYLVMQNNVASPTSNAAVENVKNIYELLTEQPVTVISVKDESGLYRVMMQVTQRDGTSNIQEAFVTKDGLLVTDRIINATGYTAQLGKERTFVECLASNGLGVAGVSTDANTVAQMQQLGNFGYKIYVECSGANLQVCQNAGITEVPVVIHNNTLYPGVRPVSFLQGLTGCSL